MRKLAVHHKGELMLHALQHGYVRVAPEGVSHPGFERQFRRLQACPPRTTTAREAAMTKRGAAA